MAPARMREAVSGRVRTHSAAMVMLLCLAACAGARAEQDSHGQGVIGDALAVSRRLVVAGVVASAELFHAAPPFLIRFCGNDPAPPDFDRGRHLGAPVVVSGDAEASVLAPGPDRECAVAIPVHQRRPPSRMYLYYA